MTIPIVLVLFDGLSGSPLFDQFVSIVLSKEISPDKKRSCPLILLDFQHSEHILVWDSCFTPDPGYINGKSFRPTTENRYRMWLTCKLASWIDQFDTSGSVGCGRCITWCPVGIDLTEEAHTLCQAPQ